MAAEDLGRDMLDIDDLNQTDNGFTFIIINLSMVCGADDLEPPALLNEPRRSG